jgi:hypothetical protein
VFSQSIQCPLASQTNNDGLASLSGMSSFGKMIISPGRAYIFVHIPKTGGTSLALALEERAKADDILIGDTPKAQRRRRRLERLKPPGRLWKHSRLADIDGLSELPDPAFVFTLVRNPWDRMVSLYHWARNQSFRHPMIEAAKALSFSEFLEDPDMASAFRNDNAVRYVTDLSGQERCDVYVRLEEFRSDITAVEQHLGFRIDMPHVNASARPASSVVYDQRTRDLVADYFADDIERFGYGFPA